MCMFRAAGSSSQSGSGANSLCMALDVNYVEVNSGSQDVGALYRMEYRTGAYVQQGWPAVNQFEVPCAVCQVPNATALWTVSGSTSCGTGYDSISSGAYRPCPT